MPQKRFHGYYPTIWRPWAPGWQAPIHEKNLPKLRQTPTAAPPQQEPTEDTDAPPAPPAAETLPLAPLDQPRPDTDEAPELPTPPGLEGMLPEPSVPGEIPTPPGLEESMPTPPGLEEPMQMPATPDEQPPPLTEPGPSSLEEPFEMPPETTLDPPPEMEEPGLIPPDLDEMPDPSLPPGFETPEMEDQPPEEDQPEPTPADETSRIPTSGRTGAANSTSPRSVTTGRSPLGNRLRRTMPSDSSRNASNVQTEPRRLSAASLDARAMPQRLPPPSDQAARPAAQARFNIPATTNPGAEATTEPRLASNEAVASQRHNPLRTQRSPVRKVVRMHNPLR